jgi:hypothetical protein
MKKILSAFDTAPVSEVLFVLLGRRNNPFQLKQQNFCHVRD